MGRPFAHRPVLVEQVVDLLVPVAGGVIVDATVGGGGHAAALLDGLGRETSVLGIDKDPAAIAAATQRLAHFGDRVLLVRGDFRDIANIVRQEGHQAVQSVLVDLGVSSPQLDVAERGLSYTKDGPLDMRMDPDAARTAADVVNGYSEEALRRVIGSYGEERFSARIAATIVRRRRTRPFTSTLDLADTVTEAIPAATRRRGRHPARRTFQALRIEVNDELNALREGLSGSVESLAEGGRLLVISYHSLEDRIVKGFIKEHGPRSAARGLPVTEPETRGVLRPLTTKAIRPSPEEIAANRRAESARLRAAEREAAA